MLILLSVHRSYRTLTVLHLRFLRKKPLTKFITSFPLWTSLLFFCDGFILISVVLVRFQHRLCFMFGIIFIKIKYIERGGTAYIRRFYDQIETPELRHTTNSWFRTIQVLRIPWVLNTQNSRQTCTLVSSISGRCCSCYRCRCWWRWRRKSCRVWRPRCRSCTRYRRRTHHL